MKCSLSVAFFERKIAMRKGNNSVLLVSPVRKFGQDFKPRLNLLFFSSHHKWCGFLSNGVKPLRLPIIIPLNLFSVSRCMVLICCTRSCSLFPISYPAQYYTANTVVLQIILIRLSIIRHVDSQPLIFGPNST